MDKKDPVLHIVLVEPEIPGNTGNIARLCAATGCCLHLVRPLGFSTDDSHLKRAGLDYWHLLDIRYHDSVAEVEALFPSQRLHLHTTHARHNHTQVSYATGDVLVFGKETAGLPKDFLARHPDRCIRLPMIDEARSLNLSNAVAVGVYEALRQNGYPGMV